MKKAILASFMIFLILATFSTVFATPITEHRVVASEKSKNINYAGLTALLAPNSNPYPAPLVIERYYNPGHDLNPVPIPTDFETMQVRHGSAYYIITELNIGAETYQGVSCNVFNGQLNFNTHNMNIQYDATWYIGALGDLSSGFKGNVEAKLFNYVGGSYDRLTVHLTMQGFGDFEGQTLILSMDSAVETDGYWRGYCVIP